MFNIYMGSCRPGPKAVANLAPMASTYADAYFRGAEDFVVTIGSRDLGLNGKTSPAMLARHLAGAQAEAIWLQFPLARRVRMLSILR